MKFSPLIHLFLCLAMLGNMLAPAVVRADPPQSNVICGRINTPKAMVDENERKENRRKLFASWKELLENHLTKQHRSSHYASATAYSVQVQDGYLFRLQSLVTEICDAQLGAERGMKELSGEISETSALSDKTQMCGRFEQLDAIYKKSNNGITKVNQEIRTRVESLKKFYVESANINLHNLDKIPDSGVATLVSGPAVQPTMWQRFFGGGPKPIPKKMPSLREEAAMVWGGNAKELQENFVPDPNSLFGGIVSRLENDLKASENSSKRLTQKNDEIKELQEKCGIGIEDYGMHRIKPSAQPDITGTPEEQRARLASADPSKIVPPGTPPQQPVVPPVDPSGKTPPYDPLKPDPAKQPPPKKEEESWFSENKGMLLTVGAGAAAVGGLLWYKNDQDKKAKKNAAALEAEASSSISSSSNSSSSSSSTSTSTDSTVGGTPANSATPQGSKFVLSGIPSGSVAVNTKLPEITVAIINPSGILTQDSHTEIIVSCVQPAGCSLTGTGQAQTSAGKAKFNDLRFTSPHESVKLMFTAPGFNSVTTVAFDVTGSGSGTNTNTNTATSTSTSTSTNTGGNRE